MIIGSDLRARAVPADAGGRHPDVRRRVGRGTGGRPAKAAALILHALDAEKAPLRLAIGDDAVDGIKTKLAAYAAELDAWEVAARDTRIGRTGARLGRRESVTSG